MVGLRCLLACFALISVSLAVAPATACENADPTGLTYTCVDQSSITGGDPTCEAAGYHYNVTQATVFVPGAAEAGVRDEDYCFRSWYHFEYHQTTVHVFVYPANSGLRVDYFDYEGTSGSGCRTSVTPIIGGSWLTYTVNCA